MSIKGEVKIWGHLGSVSAGIGCLPLMWLRSDGTCRDGNDGDGAIVGLLERSISGMISLTDDNIASAKCCSQSHARAAQHASSSQNFL